MRHLSQMKTQLNKTSGNLKQTKIVELRPNSIATKILGFQVSLAEMK
jgi:hypothetical protein